MSFPSALGSLVRRLTRSNLRCRGRGSTARRLAAESLELRCVLSSTPLDEAATVLSLADYVAQEPAMGPVLPPATAETEGSEPVDAPAADQYFADEAAEGEGDGTLSEGSGGGSANTTPILDSFSFDLEGLSIQLVGWAHDDESFAGDLTVTFTGLYEGSIPCGSDGRFSLSIEQPLLSGYIYATVSDGELVSNQLSIYIGLD